MKAKKRSLLISVISLILCFSMLVGTTFAWFTDQVVSGKNTIAAGNLNVELYHSNAAVTNERVTSTTTLFLDMNGQPILWEPGVVSYENLRVANEGELALFYQLSLDAANENFVVYPDGTMYGLSQVLQVGVVEGGITATDRAGVLASVEDANWTTLASFMRNGSLLPQGQGETEKTWGLVIYWEPGGNDNLWNLNNGKTLSSGEVLSIELGVKLEATQYSAEVDSFNNQYDAKAMFPLLSLPVTGTAAVTPTDEGKVPTGGVQILADNVTVTVPEGTQLEPGVSELTLRITDMPETESNVVIGETEVMKSLDVHVEGVAEDNTVPLLVTMPRALAPGLNMGNYNLYHVEDGVTNVMASVSSLAELNAHNQFYYDAATGDLTLYMASFSEVVAVTDYLNPWKGGVDHSWYVGKSSPYSIANGDQLWSFSQIVGGMAANVEQDSFAGKTIYLTSDINLGDGEAKNNENIIFYPIGYYNSVKSYEKKDGISVTSNVSSFEGTFDGAGHTISNFYQNTWEMFGDYNDGYSGTPNHYDDAMGLFGYVVNGTVKNLTVENFSSDGEFTPTGVIAAYAVNSTFENIALFNCNPRVYNTGNGGIIGIAGRVDEAQEAIKLKNITVDNTNKISALWGSWDVACGGLVGMYRGNADDSGDTIHFENCRVSAQIDVYNDVCANYQYYAYRYAGMIIGSVRHNVTMDGKTLPNMTGISASGCTVNYGTWNDYYYCEFEKNSMASYSEDYQFSRVDKSEILFDEDGMVIGCTHGHTAAEDKQAVYLPFHQLFTGYSWGVSSVGLKEYSGVVIDTSLDITEGDQDGSVVKFRENDTFDNTITSGTPITVGEIFAAIENPKVAIDNDTVIVSVTDITDNGITGTYTPAENWADGTLQLSGNNGMVRITIQDYNFCQPTSVIATVGTFDATGNNLVHQRAEKMTFGGTESEQLCPYCLTTQNWQPLTVSGALTTGHYYLTGDIGAITVDADNTVCLHLNGETINGDAGSGITVNAKGKLNIMGSGDVTGTGNSSGYKGGALYCLGTVNLCGGTYYSAADDANHAVTTSGGSSKINMYEGARITSIRNENVELAVSSGNVRVVSGSFGLHGGTIEKGTAKNLGGNVQVRGTFTMTGGKILGGTVTGSDASGGSINVVSGTATIKGGLISGGDGITSTKNADNGGLIYVYGGVLNIQEGARLENGYAKRGGNINVASGKTANISGGTITGGRAENGGNIYNSGTLTVTGGTVTGGTATAKGGNIYTSKDLELKNVTISGGAIAEKADNGGNIYVNGAVTLTIGAGTTITGGKANRGGNIAMTANATVNMTGGTISHGEANNLGGNVYATGTFNMTGGYLLGGWATAEDASGGSVGVFNGMVNISGGVVDGTLVGDEGQTYNAYNGGLIHIYSGTVTVSGGELKNGSLKSASSSNNGKNINMTASAKDLVSTLNLEGGIVDGGIRIATPTGENASTVVNVKGAPVVKKENYGLRLNTDCQLTITGALETNAEIFLTAAKNGQTVAVQSLPDGVTQTLTESLAFIKAYYSTYEIVVNDDATGLVYQQKTA